MNKKTDFSPQRLRETLFEKLSPFLISIVFLSACGANVPAETPAPTAPPLVGAVDILSPQLGSIIYAEILFIRGTIEGVDAFQLEIITVDGETLFDGRISSNDGQWQQVIVHEYAGEPIESVIRAKSTDTSVSRFYEEVLILISSLAYRDDGIYGGILSPNEGQAVGGDSILISGTASGVSNNRLSIILRHDNGQIDKQIITLDNPYLLDERTWTVDLLTNGFLGEAFVDIAYADSETDSEQILDTVSIVIGGAAG